jgi:murein DD-endopeptidase MepM/ murein hydrolase activator NlpD
MPRKIFLTSFIVVIAAGLFFLGFKAGLFLFSKEEINFGFLSDLGILLKEPAPAQPSPIFEKSSISTAENFCVENAKFSEENDKKFCYQPPKLFEPRGVEVDLTAQKAFMYDNGKLVKVLNLAYQSPEYKWFEAPTGYYQIGVKHKKHVSSLFPVTMPYSIQYYEDFFIHGIPYYKDGSLVSSAFTGGCLRFAADEIKTLYDFLKTGDWVVVYKTFDDLELKPFFSPPVNLDNYWIRQRFINPYRQFWGKSAVGGMTGLRLDYYNHAGVDIAPNPDLRMLKSDDEKLSVHSIFDGRIAKIQLNDGNDHGLGNTVIIEHDVPLTSSGQVTEKISSLYAHLSSVRKDLKESDIIKSGDVIGQIGNSGFGCANYWRVGKDGCDESGPSDIHLHLEIKKAPVLENPEAGKACENKNGEKRFCYGYIPDYPTDYGYLNPMEFLFDKKTDL